MKDNTLVQPTIEDQLKDGEVFIANTRNGMPEHFKSLKTVRLGTHAFTINGELILDDDSIHPIIVHQSEYMELNRLWEKELKESMERFINRDYS